MSGAQPGELRKALAEALREIHDDGRDWTWLADALLPVVTAYAERLARERAAEELRAAADAYWRDVNFPIARYPEVRNWLRARADALTADDQPVQP